MKLFIIFRENPLLKQIINLVEKLIENSFDYQIISFPAGTSKEKIKKSLDKLDINVSPGDKLLTDTTCEYDILPREKKEMFGGWRNIINIDRYLQLILNTAFGNESFETTLKRIARLVPNPEKINRIVIITDHLADHLDCDGNDGGLREQYQSFGREKILAREIMANYFKEVYPNCTAVEIYENADKIIDSAGKDSNCLFVINRHAEFFRTKDEGVKLVLRGDLSKWPYDCIPFCLPLAHMILLLGKGPCGMTEKVAKNIYEVLQK